MRLQGIVAERGADWVMVDVGGVGHRVELAATHAAALRPGDEVTLWTHEVVRDDRRELFGVRSRASLELLWQLVSVSGVGPKAAVKILGLFDADTLKRHVMQGDADALTAVPGIGKKKAQTIILHLRGSIDFDDAGGVGAASQLVEALVSLGYQQKEARDMARRVNDQDSSLDEQLKIALAHAA